MTLQRLNVTRVTVNQVATYQTIWDSLTTSTSRGLSGKNSSIYFSTLLYIHFYSPKNGSIIRKQNKNLNFIVGLTVGSWLAVTVSPHFIHFPRLFPIFGIPWLFQFPGECPPRISFNKGYEEVWLAWNDAQHGSRTDRQESTSSHNQSLSEGYNYLLLLDTYLQYHTIHNVQMDEPVSYDQQTLQTSERNTHQWLGGFVGFLLAALSFFCFIRSIFVILQPLPQHDVEIIHCLVTPALTNHTITQLLTTG